MYSILKCKLNTLLFSYEVLKIQCVFYACSFPQIQMHVSGAHWPAHMASGSWIGQHGPTQWAACLIQGAKLSLSGVHEYGNMLFILHEYWWIPLAGPPSKNPALEKGRGKAFWATIGTKAWVLSCAVQQERKWFSFCRGIFRKTKDLPRSHSWSWQSGEGTQAWLQSPGAFQCVMFYT